MLCSVKQTERGAAELLLIVTENFTTQLPSGDSVPVKEDFYILDEDFYRNRGDGHIHLNHRLG